MASKPQKKPSSPPSTRQGGKKPIKKTEKRTPPIKRQAKWKQEHTETSTSLPEVES